MWSLISQSLHWFLAGSLAYSLVWYDVHTIRVIIATTMHTLCVYIIKETVRIDRIIENHGIGHALPSLYASLAIFIASYYTYLFTETEWTTTIKIYRILLTTTYAILVCTSRVLLEYNTTLDVLLGAFTGILCTILFVTYQKTYTIEIKYE